LKNRRRTPPRVPDSLRCTSQPRRFLGLLPVSGGDADTQGARAPVTQRRAIIGDEDQNPARGAGVGKCEHSDEQHHHRAAAAGHGRGRPDPVHRSPQRPGRPPARSAPGGDGREGQGCCRTRPPLRLLRNRRGSSNVCSSTAMDDLPELDGPFSTITSAGKSGMLAATAYFISAPPPGPDVSIKEPQRRTRRSGLSDPVVCHKGWGTGTKRCFRPG